MDWTSDDYGEGGCPLIMASIELDDQPGPLRAKKTPARPQKNWGDVVIKTSGRLVKSP